MCPFQYIGETSINAYTRRKEHIEQYKSLLSKQLKSYDDTTSVLYKHKQSRHAAQDSPVFSMSVTGRHDSAMTRQVTEGIPINNTIHHLIRVEQYEDGEFHSPSTVAGTFHPLRQT